jgi:hypothetical protein
MIGLGMVFIFGKPMKIEQLSGLKKTRNSKIRQLLGHLFSLEIALIFSMLNILNWLKVVTQF